MRRATNRAMTAATHAPRRMARLAHAHGLGSVDDRHPGRRAAEAVEFLLDQGFDAHQEDVEVEILRRLDRSRHGDPGAVISPHGVNGDSHPVSRISLRRA